MEDQKSIGLLGAVSIGIGGTIGPSMFVILGFAASMAHYYVFISIILAGIIALAIGLIYAELATTFPEMGGGYFYIREAFGGFISFFAGFSLWIGYMAYGAVCALGFGYILALADSMLGARREFLDSEEMAIFISSMVQLKTSTTLAFLSSRLAFFLPLATSIRSFIIASLQLIFNAANITNP